MLAAEAQHLCQDAAAMRLLTIPISHYCERARWALDHCGLDYEEEQHLQIFHIRPVRKAGGRHFVPLLVTDEGALTSSGDIVAYADRHARPHRRLYDEDASKRESIIALEATYAGDFGVETRRYAYHRLLPHRALVTRYNGAAAPLHERLALRLGFPFARRKITRYLRIEDETVRAGADPLSQTFDAVAARLSDGRPYLTGDNFTAADLTFAAMAAPLVFPSEYGARRRQVALPSLPELPPQFRAEVEQFRSHPAGAFVLRLYRRARMTPP